KIANIAEQLISNIKEQNDIKIIATTKNNIAIDIVRGVATILRNKFANEKFVLIFGSSVESKPSLTVVLSQSMVDAGYNATTIVREAAKAINGNGGGQPFMATAGGKDISGLNQAVENAIATIK
ncbi:MAG: alanine--tRNA ligase, partial [Paludibacteraceae bacterium]|nr:alanine--tRNA ligase [Paludibacteraceae bacterium]